MWKLPGVSRTSNPRRFQLGSDRVPYLLVRVPVGDRVGDVIDARRVGRPATRVTSDDERIAYRETALFSIVPRKPSSRTDPRRNRVLP